MNIKLIQTKSDFDELNQAAYETVLENREPVKYLGERENQIYMERYRFWYSVAHPETTE